MGERPALFLGLLADQPELIAEVGVLRWRASGTGGTAGPWIESTARDAGRDGLPFTLVAMDLEGRAIGAVTLCEHDSHLDEGLRGDRSPWLVNMVVRHDERRCGVGRLMIAAVEDLARERCCRQVWVAAADEDVVFYRHCGWEGDERWEVAARRGSPAAVTVLTKVLSAELTATT
jgi:GNAT superfamily N-acetyltransferase